MDTIKHLVKQYRISILLILISFYILKRLMGTVCYSAILLGIPCPACGLTRAAGLLASGRFRESFHMHPLLFLVIIGVILYPMLKSTTRNYKLFMNIYVIITMVTFVCLYIYRMLNLYPAVEPMVYHKDNMLAKLLAIIQYMGH